ncbi:hypothetical protein [Rhodococcus sp. ACT016]|uniref:hypothetical protein n=1 Tax=Rhodococcus sp. ACT016 TaxID=3134808 RepID=UPI003D29BE5A
MTVNIPNEDVAKLTKIAKRHRSNRTSALVRAIRIASYIDDQMADEARVVIVDKDGKEHEVEFC